MHILAEGPMHAVSLNPIHAKNMQKLCKIMYFMQTIQKKSLYAFGSWLGFCRWSGHSRWFTSSSWCYAQHPTDSATGFSLRLGFCNTAAGITAAQIARHCEAIHRTISVDWSPGLCYLRCSHFFGLRQRRWKPMWIRTSSQLLVRAREGYQPGSRERQIIQAPALPMPSCARNSLSSWFSWFRPSTQSTSAPNQQRPNRYRDFRAGTATLRPLDD